MFTFAKVPALYFGAGNVRKLPEILAKLSSRNILLVIGRKSLEASGRLSEIQVLLRREGIANQVVTCMGEPTTPEIDRICQEKRADAIDAVVGIGGGSAIDMGKAISAMLPHDNSIFDHLEGVGKGIPHSGIKVPYIAIPTTSGTGGEVTKNAVISEVGDNGYKKSLRHENLIPDAVIVDGELLVSCPRLVTAACGMDAFTQLLEPYLSPTASPFTDAIAWGGLELMAANLLPACGEGAKDIAVREKMACASLMSGIALANAGLGIVHGLASPIGGFFPIPHGVVCGTLMAEAVRVNWLAIKERDLENPAAIKMAKLGELLSGKTGQSISYYCDVLVAILAEWTERLEIPRLGEYGVGKEDLDKILDKTRNRNNPIELSREEIQRLVEARL